MSVRNLSSIEGCLFHSVDQSSIKSKTSNFIGSTIITWTTLIGLRLKGRFKEWLDGWVAKVDNNFSRLGEFAKVDNGFG